MRYTIRFSSVNVFPVPAPANIMSGPGGCVIADNCLKFGVGIFVSIVIKNHTIKNMWIEDKKDSLKDKMAMVNTEKLF